MERVLLVIHLIVTVSLVLVVLLQRSANDGGGLMGGGGTMGGLFTARGSANLLTRTTAILATVFFAVSLLLAFIAGQKHNERNITENIKPIAPVQEEKSQAPAPLSTPVPQVPVSK